MPDVVLATINAKYIHASFGLRCLAANLPGRSVEILEFTLDRRPADIAETLLAAKPKILGLGVYIWNATETRELVAVLRRVAPELTIVLGGPEVSHEHEAQPIVGMADYLITGEGETAFAQLCARVLEGKRPLTKVIEGGLPDLEAMALPYALYSDHDIEHRVIYVEASRGCPYKCEFCLSSLDKKVRAFPLEPFLGAMQSLVDRGVRQFKFVDRTFNLDLKRSRAILEFFYERVDLGIFAHFEMVPDRFPAELRELVARFPEGALQFEVGIQSLDAEVGKRISRRQDFDKMASNLEFLRTETGVHLHTDLIVGLPGESMQQFAQGFDKLVGMRVQEIQVGVLKRLRGTPIVRHDEPHAMVYSQEPPYEILQTADIDFETMQRLKRFAGLWNRVVNEGNFATTAPRLWAGPEHASPFHGFLAFSDWVFAETGRVHSISLINLARLLANYLSEHRGQPLAEVEQGVRDDFVHAGRGAPTNLARKTTTPNAAQAPPKRQARHRGAAGQN